MSTTIKRVALVAVAALSLGVISVAPSQAIINSDSLVLSSATASQTTAETYTATSATATLTFLAGAEADSMSVVASLVSGPATSVALPRLRLIETSSAIVDSTTGVIGGIAKGTDIVPNTKTVVSNSTSGAAVVTAKYAVFLGTSATAAPSVVGTYVVKLTPALHSGTTGGGNATAQTLTITVTAAPTLDKVITTATSIISVTAESATADQIVTASKTAFTSSYDAGTANMIVANIKVTPKNAAGTTVGTTNSANAGESLTATISGPGTLGSAAWGSFGVSRGRAISVKAGDFITVYPDGQAGTSTVTISSALGVVLATETLTFFGAPASIVTTVQSSVLNATANAVDTTDYTTAPLKVVVKDASGVAVSNLAASLRVTSETTTIVSDSYAANTCSYDLKTSAYYCSLQGVAAGKTNITVGTKTSATDTTATNFNGNVVAVRVGTQVAASIKVTSDKSTYAPGEKATIKVELLDADGLQVADGRYLDIFAAGGISTDFQLGTGSDTLTAVVVEESDGTAAIGGVREYTVYMPQNTGTITFSWKTAGTAVTGTAPVALNRLAVANQAVAGSFAVTVSNPSVDAATDAANEAAQAASDATDAALAAADAADAATTKAQEAVDAVATLSAQVSKLITALKAQITTLTNLVIKIQKKVKA